MGLDLCAEGSSIEVHWAYSGFTRFRTRLAAAHDIRLERMAGFTSLDPRGMLGPAILWETVSTPLAPLLYHSDCDGEMTPAECAQVAPALLAVVESWPEEAWDYDRDRGLELVVLMRYCAAQGVPLLFT